MSKIKKIVLSALFLALLIVLSRFFSIKTQVVVISFSFVPIMLSAIILGPKYSTAIAALGDFIGAILFPFGNYFPGFTLSAAVSGLIYGLLLYEKGGGERPDPEFAARLAISSALVLGVVDLLITPVWIKMLYGNAYLAVVASRVTVKAVMFPLHIAVMFALMKLLRPPVRKYLL